MMAGIGWAQKCWALAQLRTYKSTLTTPLTRDEAHLVGHAPSLVYYDIVATAEAYAHYRYVWL